MILKLYSSFLVLTKFAVMVLQRDIARLLLVLINEGFPKTDVGISQECRLEAK